MFVFLSLRLGCCVCACVFLGVHARQPTVEGGGAFGYSPRSRWLGYRGGCEPAVCPSLAPDTAVCIFWTWSDVRPKPEDIALSRMLTFNFSFEHIVGARKIVVRVFFKLVVG